MKLTNRQRRMIELLLGRQEEMTAAGLAEAVGTSVRTIHRELPDIESALTAAGLVLVKKSGFGIRIEGEPEAVADFRQRLAELRPDQYASSDRKLLILCRLLADKEPVKLFSLAHDLHVAVPTVTADLDELETVIDRNGLTLVRRRGFGVQLTGDEPVLRRMIVRLAREQLDDAELFGQDEGDAAADPVTRRLLEMIGKHDAFFRVEKALWQLEDKRPTTLDEPDYTLLLITLSVGLTRCRQGFVIPPPDAASALPGTAGSAEAGGGTPPDGDAGGKLRDYLAALALELPPGEAVYAEQALQSWDNGAPAALLADHMRLADTALGMIRLVEEGLGTPLVRDRSLLDGLVRHLQPALDRLRDGSAIRNPLLAQIRRDYEALFAIVRRAVDRSFAGVAVPDEEIGFLVMHFGAALERLKQFPRSVRALLVCTSGIGSSKLLAVRINKELPQIELIGRVSWFEASRVPAADYDLIISTVDLPVDPDRYIKLSPLLTGDEAERLRAFIQSITLRRLPTSAGGGAEKTAEPLERLRRIGRFAGETVRLLDQFAVIDETIPPDECSLRAVLYRVCARAGRLQALTQIDPVVAALIQREAQGSQQLPETELALFHTRSDRIVRPYLALHRLDAALPLHSGGEPGVRHVLLMLAPRDLTPESLEVLSEISGMLLAPELLRLLESGAETAIRRFLADGLHRHLQTKMEWSDKQ